jgi:DNA-binding response OmpR family regulator
LHVLVVEDGWQVADALRLVLEQMGMIVAGPVATPGEARSLASQVRPALAVVDVNLKGVMAYELMDWLHDKGIRVIVISGYEDHPCSLAKFPAIMRKPFTVKTLLATLQRVVEGRPTP